MKPSNIKNNNISGNCYLGYDGKDCANDISECEENPCINDGQCFEKSNSTLYSPDIIEILPPDLQDVFRQEFSYDIAAGYVCSCMPGYEGIYIEFSQQARKIKKV